MGAEAGVDQRAGRTEALAELYHHLGQQLKVPWTADRGENT